MRIRYALIEPLDNHLSQAEAPVVGHHLRQLLIGHVPHRIAGGILIILTCCYASLLGSGFDEYKKPDQLEEAIRAALLQADSDDRQVFESMGLKTIWVDRFDQVPNIIAAIPR